MEDNDKSKDWLKSASASLSQLKQVSPSVYSIRLADSVNLSANNIFHNGTHKPDTSTVLNQTTNSNVSVSDLMKHSNRLARPASAKCCRSASLTPGKRTRPHSAKNASTAEKKKPPIGVKGLKYDQAGKCAQGEAPEGWVGPPAGLKMDDVINIIPNLQSEADFLDVSRFDGCNGNVPPPPQATPEPESTLDGFSEVESVSSDANVVLLRKPTQDSIHLSLPTAGEEQEEEEEEWNTERVLQEVQTLTNKRQEVRVKYHHRASLQATEKQAAIQEDERPRSKSPSSYNINERTITLLPSSTDSKVSHARSNPTESDKGVMIREDKNLTFQITPRNRGHKVNYKIAKCYSNLRSRSRKLDFTHVRSRVNSGIDVRTVINDCKTKRITEPSNLNNSLQLELGMQVKPLKTNTGNTSPSSVPIVTVKYEDVDKPVKQGKKPEIVTVVSQYMSESEDESEHSNRNDRSAVSRSRSNLSKNYYEVAMRTEQGKMTGDKEESSPPVLYKTIKTIEFDEAGYSPKESTVKSIIPGTVSTTKPRQKLAVSVDYLGRQRSSSVSSNTSVRKDDHRSIQIPGPSQEENVSKSEQSLKKENTEDKKLDDKLLNTMSKWAKPPMKSRTVQPNQRRNKQTKTQLRRDADSQSSTSEMSEISAKNLSSSKQDALVQSETESITLSRPDSGSTVKSRPASCFQSSLQRMKSFDTRRIQSAALAAEREHRKYAVYTRSFARRQIMQSPPPPTDVVYLNTKKHPDVDTEESLACQEMQNKLASLGLNIRKETLERALFPPSGKTLHYEISRDVIRSPASGLLSHPKFWLPTEYMKVKIAEKQLARAEHTMWLQKREEEREVKSALGLTTSAATKTKKNKKKGKKKTKRPASVS